MPSGTAGRTGRRRGVPRTAPRGIYILGVGNGFKITAPADTTQRTLTVYVSAYNARGQMVAHLSDASSPDYVNSTLNGVQLLGARGLYVYLQSGLQWADAVGDLHRYHEQRRQQQRDVAGGYDALTSVQADA